MSRRTCTLCRKRLSQGDRRSLHKFPDDEKLKQSWIEAAGLSSIKYKTAFLCSDHFEPSSFFDYKSKDGKQRLVAHAVPVKSCKKMINQPPALNSDSCLSPKQLKNNNDLPLNRNNQPQQRCSENNRKNSPSNLAIDRKLLIDKERDSTLTCSDLKPIEVATDSSKKFSNDIPVNTPLADGQRAVNTHEDGLSPKQVILRKDSASEHPIIQSIQIASKKVGVTSDKSTEKIKITNEIDDNVETEEIPCITEIDGNKKKEIINTKRKSPIRNNIPKKVRCKVYGQTMIFTRENFSTYKEWYYFTGAIAAERQRSEMYRQRCYRAERKLLNFKQLINELKS